MRRFKALTRPLGAFVSTQAATTIGLAVAVTAAAALAAAVDGHAPEPAALMRVSLPAAGLGGLAFTVSRWRREQADVALAALGVRPLSVMIVGALLAGALCLARPERAAVRGNATLEVTPARLLARVDGRTLEVDFSAWPTRRNDLGRAWDALPAPTGETSTQDHRPTPRGLWWALAGALSWALARGPVPGLGRTLVTLGGVVAAAWALGL